MAYYASSLKAKSFIVRVYDPSRSKKPIEKREFNDYYEANVIHSQLEERYRGRYIVELDTEYR